MDWASTGMMSADFVAMWRHQGQDIILMHVRCTGVFVKVCRAVQVANACFQRMMGGRTLLLVDYFLNGFIAEWSIVMLTWKYVLLQCAYGLVRDRNRVLISRGTSLRVCYVK